MTEAVTVNGKEVPFVPGTSVMRILEDLGYDVRRIAVEIDGDICPRSELGSTPAVNGNRIEVVSFVGGG